MTVKSICVQYRCNHSRSNYIVDVRNNVTFFPNIFNSQLVESADSAPVDTERRLYLP